MCPRTIVRSKANVIISRSFAPMGQRGGVSAPPRINGPSADANQNGFASAFDVFLDSALVSLVVRGTVQVARREGTYSRLVGSDAPPLSRYQYRSYSKSSQGRDVTSDVVTIDGVWAGLPA